MLGLGKVQGICNTIIAASDRIPYAWKLRMINRLEEIIERTVPKYGRYGNDWHRARTAMNKAIRHLKKETETS